MVKKKTKATSIKENDSYIIPSLNNEMKEFIIKFKIDMMEHVVHSIKYAIDNNLTIVELFQFKNSPFVITISDKEFNKNLAHIHDYFMKNEIYELCPNIKQLQEILKNKNNEKEK